MLGVLDLTQRTARSHSGAPRRSAPRQKVAVPRRWPSTDARAALIMSTPARSSAVVCIPSSRRPLMLRIGDDDCAVGELDLVARPAEHDVRRRDHPRRLPVGAEQSDHRPRRRPSSSSPSASAAAYRRQRLPDTRPRRDDDHLARDADRWSPRRVRRTPSARHARYRPWMRWRRSRPSSAAGAPPAARSPRTSRPSVTS